MFTRDDFGRGRRLPLLWIFGPLLIGALLVTGIGIAARATQGCPNIELAAELEDLAASGDPMLSEVTGFAWDRVCVFPQAVTADDVDATLGFDWGVVGGDPLGDDRLLLVFVADDEVVSHLYLRRGVVDAPPDDGECRSPEDEGTRL
jgi:hypothetical protein